MAESLERRVTKLERQAQTGAGATTVTVIQSPGSGSSGGSLDIQSNGVTVASEPRLDFIVTDPNLMIQVKDDPQNQRVIVTLSTNLTFAPAELDVGLGSPTGTGYTLSSTTGAAINTTPSSGVAASLVVSGVAAGWRISFEFNGKVIAGTGDVIFDILSVKSGNYVGEGISNGGIAGWRCSASTTTYKSATKQYDLTATDVDPNGNATFQLMYRLSASGGSPQLIANDADGHFYFDVLPRGPVNPTSGTNTGPPPVTPPAIGGVTVVTPVSNSSTTSTATLSTGSVTPVAGECLYAIVLLHLAGVNPATVTMSDTIGDAGGAHTAWTNISAVHGNASGSNPANSNSIWCFRRTVGNGPAAGVVTATRDAGSHQQDFNLAVLRVSGVTETPTQTALSTPTNVTSIPLTLTASTGGNRIVISFVNNPNNSGTATAPVLPVSGGTWNSVVDTVLDGDGKGIAYLASGTVPASHSFTGLTADTIASLAGAIVLDPSGSSTPAPGTESWNSAADNSTGSNISGDQTWFVRTS